MPTSVLPALTLGFALGARHATDADHLVAVCTMVARARTLRSASAVGAAWGLGHTATVFLFGGPIIGLDLVIPPRVGLGLELLVAAMLIVLGVLAATGKLRNAHTYAHSLEGDAATSPSSRASFTSRSEATPSRHVLIRPLVIGIIHGLAGSAAIALLVLSSIRSVPGALAYLALFGVGTVLGMMVLTSAIAVPFRATTTGSRIPKILGQLSAFGSIAFGLYLAARIGFVDGLFLEHVRWTPQ